MKNRISLIIVHHQTLDLLNQQLVQLLAISKEKTLDLEIIVVDNSQQVIKKDLPKSVKFISNPYNRGFSFACNQGANIAQGDWLFFLNPDVFFESNQITDILEFAQTNQFDALSPLGESSNYQKTIPSLFSILAEFSPLGKLPGFTKLIKAKSPNLTLVGGTLLIKKQILQDLGGWDERFFLWFEDSDLSRRLIDKDYKIGFYPQAVNHLGGQSFTTLDPQFKKDIFFNALDIYSRKHLSKFSQKLINLLKKRYTTQKLIPIINPELTSIVVPNLKIELLKTFLEQNIDFFDFQTQELIIVSSALDTQNIWQFRQNYPQVRFIILEKNLGFAHTVNIGMRAASGKFLGTTNDDVVLTKNWIKDLISNQDSQKQIGAINPMVMTPQGKIESAGIKILKKGKAQPLTLIDSSQKIKEVDATNAACVIYDKKALGKIGLFDESFTSYLEDIDLALRLNQAQFKNIVNTQVKVTHQGHTTTNKINLNKSWLDYKNWWKVVIKNWSINDWVIYFPLILLERARNFSGVIKSLKSSPN